MLGKTNSSVGGKVNNQDLYITDNGVYTAGEGFTGLGVVDVNVPKGEQVTAINKTGATITTGQKVWLNENAQTQGSNYNLANLSVTDASYVGLISRTGNFGWCANKLYSIGSDTATYISDLSTKNGYLFKYMDNGSVFKCYGANYQGQATRVDENAQYILDTAYPLSGNLFYRYTTDDHTGNVQEINLDDGSVIKTYKVGYSSAKIPWAVINGKIYTLESNARRWTLNEDLTTTQDTYTFENATTLYVAGTTLDNKYVIAGTDEAFSVGAANNYLRLVEVIDENTLKCLTQSEMPEDLQEFYSTSCRIVFNPYTGILTVAAYGGLSYAVMKYENGTWTKLPVDLGLENYPNKFLQTAITVSDDLSRACVGIGATPYNLQPYIINLNSTSGYSAVPYRFYNVTENTITGYAGNDAESGEEVIVGVGSVPSVNNGGNGGDSGSYEIDYDLVTVVNDYGTIEFSSNDNGNVTVLSGFDGSNGFWFNAAPTFGVDESIEYQFKFRLNDDNVSALVYTVALGDFQTHTETPNITFLRGTGDNKEYLIISLDRVTGTTETVLDIPQILGQWVTVNVRLNEYGYWQIYTDIGAVEEYTKATAHGTFSMPINYYLLFANTYGRTPAISVDLEGTGFKQNGEWVYRCVKQI